MNVESVAVRLGARGITRRFGSVVANRDVDLSVAPGTIHAIVGENGAGKTTLMKTLYGLEKPEEGTVIVDDDPVNFSRPAEALQRGIGMVHQEFMLVPDFTLLENLLLGEEPTRGPVISWRTARASAEELSNMVGVELDWDTLAAQTPVSSQQQLEILRLLYREANVLILDEPTAVLAPQQVEELFGLLRSLRDNGYTVIFISHKLNEVLEIADSITVLKAGEVVGETSPEDTDASSLAEMMVGNAVPTARTEENQAETGETILSVEGLRAQDDRGIERLQEAHLSVRAGEIVGVAGVVGNGQDELVECIVGARRSLGGHVLLNGEEIINDSVLKRRNRGLAYVPSDRSREGLALAASITDNAIAGNHRQQPLASRGWLKRKSIRRFVGELLERFGIRYGTTEDPGDSLSGGNQQRLVLGRALAHEPKILVASQPTRGVDINGITFVHNQLLELRSRGGAVLLMSEELEELTSLCDRIVVLYGGRVAGEVSGSSTEPAELGRLMTGEARPA